MDDLDQLVFPPLDPASIVIDPTIRSHITDHGNKEINHPPLTLSKELWKKDMDPSVFVKIGKVESIHVDLDQSYIDTFMDDGGIIEVGQKVLIQSSSSDEDGFTGLMNIVWGTDDVLGVIDEDDSDILTKATDAADGDVIFEGKITCRFRKYIVCEFEVGIHLNMLHSSLMDVLTQFKDAYDTQHRIDNELDDASINSRTEWWSKFKPMKNIIVEITDEDDDDEGGDVGTFQGLINDVEGIVDGEGEEGHHIAALRGARNAGIVVGDNPLSQISALSFSQAEGGGLKAEGEAGGEGRSNVEVGEEGRSSISKLIGEFKTTANSSLPPVNDAFRVIPDIHNLQDSVRKHIGYHPVVHNRYYDEDESDTEPPEPINFERLKSLQDASNECGMTIWRLHGNQDSPSKDIISPKYHIHIHTLMIVYDGGEGTLQLLYPKRHRKSWAEYETVPYPSSLEDLNYRDAFGCPPFPYFYPGDRAGLPRVSFKIRYGRGSHREEGERLRYMHFADTYAIQISNDYTTQATIDEIRARLRGEFGEDSIVTGQYVCLNYNNMGRTRDEVKEVLARLGVYPRSTLHAFKSCASVFHSSNGHALRYEEKTRLIHHVNKNGIVKKLRDKHAEREGNGQYDPSKYNPESTALVDIFNEDKIFDTNICGSTVMHAWGGGNAKTHGSHATPLSLADMEFAVFRTRLQL